MRQSIAEVLILKPCPWVSRLTPGQPSGFVPIGEDWVFQSRLTPGVSVSEHLKWLQGILQFELRKLRKLQEVDVEMICRIRVKERMVTIEAEALFLMHPLHLRTEMSFHP